jgi:hypothetical protein
MILRNVSSLTSSAPFSRENRKSWVLGISSAACSQTRVNDEASEVDVILKRSNQSVVDKFHRQIPALLVQPTGLEVIIRALSYNGDY